MLNTLTLIAATMLGGDLIPTRLGSFWKFRMDGEKESTWKLSPLPDGKITLVDWSDEGDTPWENMKWVVVEGGEASHFSIMEGDSPRFIIKNTGDEIRMYRHEFGTWYVIDWVIRTDDFQEGRSFRTPRAYAGCGFWTELVSCTVKSEKVLLPAGEFHAFRFDSDLQSLWIVPGIGIVKMTNGHSTFELSEWGVPKGGR